MATMINNIVLMIISSKFDLAEMIGNHYFHIGWKKKVKSVSGSVLLSPPFKERSEWKEKMKTFIKWSFRD